MVLIPFRFSSNTFNYFLEHSACDHHYSLFCRKIFNLSTTITVYAVSRDRGKTKNDRTPSREQLFRDFNGFGVKFYDKRRCAQERILKFSVCTKQTEKKCPNNVLMRFAIKTEFLRSFYAPSDNGTSLKPDNISLERRKYKLESFNTNRCPGSID